ncbi:uncharacterized protein LOC116128083 [Pistacia vera]|uniref:Uncharacterized protein n=3 Tax=Pistacia TaxID=55512 RepID=A0ACC1C7M3_9ROSI|nr:uncharacterized protein LOC116128083 [Pistacia vera]KAJ0054606.1 hypothetical protein Pint_00200 [Pistacia integerrima]KAJ0110661.1 hypothetical protein Patl1_00221 [Pistacia atlantica]KAJ0111540.1 hypothetical protein Patl1_00207 [Pistacia atlantica]
MSISYCFLVFLLCLSLHACNARRLGDTLEKKLHTTNKNDEKKGLDTVPVVPKADSLLTTRGDRIEDHGSGEKSQKSKDTRDAESKISNDGTGKTSGAAKTESLGSVSWRVPHGKRPEKNPGFNSDYSPPKTHPPSHN